MTEVFCEIKCEYNKNGRCTKKSIELSLDGDNGIDCDSFDYPTKTTLKTDRRIKNDPWVWVNGRFTNRPAD